MFGARRIGGGPSSNHSLGSTAQPSGNKTRACTTDEVTMEGPGPARSMNILGDRLAGVAELSDDDANALRNVIDGLIAKSRLRTLAATSADELPRFVSRSGPATRQAGQRRDQVRPSPRRAGRSAPRSRSRQARRTCRTAPGCHSRPSRDRD